MMNFSYNSSGKIKENIEQIDSLRTAILLTPLSPKDELRFRWNIMEQKIFYSLYLADSPLTKKQMRLLLTNHLTSLQKRKNLTLPEEDILDYRLAFDHIKRDWLASPKIVSLKTLATLNSLSSGGRIIPMHETQLQSLLDYIQSQEEHPIIKAAISLIQINTIRPFTIGNERTARLFSDLLLYKYGFDVRGAIFPEKYWAKNRSTFERLSRNTSDYITPWIEFFTLSIRTQLEEAMQTLTPNFSSDINLNRTKDNKDDQEDAIDDKLFDINERQKFILSILDEPLTTVTNKKIQKLCRVSQITASRDLGRLTTLGLLFAHGKGRSVYYTKI